MSKLEYTPVNDWERFNLLGKRLFDFVNSKINIRSGIYTGDGVTGKQINVDVIPRLILIFSEDALTPVIWIDVFAPPLSKAIDGLSLDDAIIGLAGRKEGFILGPSVFVNDAGVSYYYLVLGE